LASQTQTPGLLAAALRDACF